MSRGNQSFFDITAFGAVGDARRLNTATIQRAIHAAHTAGGGSVIISPGTYRTGTLELLSDVTLVIQPGATLLGSETLADYKPLQAGHNQDRTRYHLIVAHDAQRISITGGGTIDGSGPAFWQAPENDLAWIRTNERPSPMIDLVRCSDVRISDITLTRSPGWTCHTHDCNRVWIRGVRIDNDVRSPNSDGFDVTGCHDVMISDCHIVTGDDAICLKTTPDSRDIRRVTVTNCIIQTDCAALKLGAGESFHDMRQVTFSNCVIHRSSRAVALYSLEGGTLADIAISNIVCDTCNNLVMNRPIHMDLRQKSADSALGAIKNVSISNFIARTDGRILMTAQPGAMLENIRLRDIHLVYPAVDDPHPIGKDIGGGQISNQSPAARMARAAVVAENIINLTIDDLTIDWCKPEDTPLPEWELDQKRCNGSHRIYTREEFRPEITPIFTALWGRNLAGGRIHAPLAHSNIETAARFDISSSDIELEPLAFLDPEEDDD